MATKLKNDEVATALRETDGNVSAAAKRSQVARQTLHRFIAARPSLQSVLAECRETMKDEAESSLYKAVKEGEAWAVCFFLKTQAKDRGYVEKQEYELLERRHAELEERLAKLIAEKKAGQA